MPSIVVVTVWGVDYIFKVQVLLGVFVKENSPICRGVFNKLNSQIRNKFESTSVLINQVRYTDALIDKIQNRSPEQRNLKHNQKRKHICSNKLLYKCKSSTERTQNTKIMQRNENLQLNDLESDLQHHHGERERKLSRSLNNLNLPKVLVTDLTDKNHLLNDSDELRTRSTPCSPRTKRRAFTTCIAGTRYVIGRCGNYYIPRFSK